MHRRALSLSVAITEESTRSFLADVYEAIYAYAATDPADLSFNAGERITILQSDGEWWTGRIGQRTGTFPHNYVQKVENVRFNSFENVLSSRLFSSSHCKKLPWLLHRLKPTTKVVCRSIKDSWFTFERKEIKAGIKARSE